MPSLSRILAPLILVIAKPATAFGQVVQPWPTLFVSGPVADGILASGEAINRVSAESDRPSQLELRFHLGHAVTKRLTLWAGYVHTVTYQADRQNGIENQAVEQANWNVGTLGPVRITSRTRLEQRFIRGVSATSWRVREQLRAALPLTRGGPSAVLWAEPFVALNTTSTQRETFDQLRLFAGFALPVTRHADFEIGYLRQHLHRTTGDIDNNAIPLTVNLRF